MLSSRILVEGNYKLETIGQPKLNSSEYCFPLHCYIWDQRVCKSTLSLHPGAIWNVDKEHMTRQQRVATVTVWDKDNKTEGGSFPEISLPPSPFLPKKAKAYHTTLSPLMIGLWSDRISIYIFRLHFVRMAQSIKCVVVGDGAVGASLISI